MDAGKTVACFRAGINVPKLTCAGLYMYPYCETMKRRVPHAPKCPVRTHKIERNIRGKMEPVLTSLCLMMSQKKNGKKQAFLSNDPPSR